MKYKKRFTQYHVLIVSLKPFIKYNYYEQFFDATPCIKKHVCLVILMEQERMALFDLRLRL